MKDRVPVLVNRQGGAAAAKGDTLRDTIEAAFAMAGVPIDLHLLDAERMPAAIERHVGEPLVVVGGGDGTLRTAAEVLLRRGTTLGILPLGTRNHLARELGIPPDLPAAATLIAQRTTRRIDVARVNGRLFVNNASIGLYPDMVRRREGSALPKWLAAIPASWAALKRLRHHRLHLHTPNGDRRVVTPMLFIGNNHYALEAGRVGTRSALDDGMLCVLAVARRDRGALIGFALRAIVGRADPAKDFAAIGDVPALVVTTRSRHIDVALDGEVTRLSTPLDFTVEARALTVVAPPA